LGDEPAQLRRLADATEARLQRVQEEKEKAIEALKKEKEEVLEKLRVARYCVTAYENEKDEFWAMLEEDKERYRGKRTSCSQSRLQSKKW
jgi:DNA-directed RNA polymerase subunit N (RpoN/RPB10)